MATRAALPGPGDVATVRLVRAFSRDPYGSLLDLRRSYGDVVRLGVGSRTMAVLLFGRDLNQQVLHDEADAMRWGPAFAGLVPVDGPTALVVSDGDDHARRRRLVQPAFHRRRIDGYLTLMQAELDTTIDQWRPGTTVDAYHDLRPVVRRTVVRALFGPALHDRADEIGDLLQPALDFVNLPPTRQLRFDLPATAYRRARLARLAVDRVIDGEVRRRSATPEDDGGDVLGMLLQARDDAGDALDAAELRDQVVSLIAAGYDTTSAALGWAVHRATSEPGVWEQATAEVDAVVGDRQLQVDDLPHLVHVDGIVQETLRLHPPGVLAPRVTATDVALGGHVVPADTMVLYSPYATHVDPELWPHPDRFRPERWDARRPDHQPPAPFSFVPFGGGGRRCIGFALATLQIKAALVRLLQRADVSTDATATVRPRGLASVLPDPGVPLKLRAVR